MDLKKAIKGLVITLTAEGYSERTIILYEQHLHCLSKHLGDIDVNDITTFQLREWLVWLRDSYRTHRGKQLTSKSVYNHWITIRRFFRFAKDEGLTVDNPSLSVKAPKHNSPPPDPFATD